MAAGNYDITIEQGAKYSLDLTFYTDKNKNNTEDFTGNTWRMKIRDSVSSSTVIEELTSANNKIDISNQDQGIITLKLTAPTTEAYTFTEGVYDLERVIDSDDVRRMLQGTVTLDKEVTR